MIPPTSPATLGFMLMATPSNSRGSVDIRFQFRVGPDRSLSRQNSLSVWPLFSQSATHAPFSSTVHVQRGRYFVPMTGAAEFSIPHVINQTN